MNFIYRKLTTKTTAVITIFKTLYSKKGILISQDKTLAQDTLVFLKQGTSSSGLLTALNFFQKKAFDSTTIDLQWWLLYQFKQEKQILQAGLQRLNSLLECNKTQYLEGAKLGESDIIAYTKLKKFCKGVPQSLNDFPLLQQWYEKTDKELAEKITPEAIQKYIEADAALILQQKNNLCKQKEKNVEKKDKKSEKAEKKQKAEVKAQKAKNQPQGKEKVFKKKQEDIDPEYLNKFQNQKIKRLPIKQNPTPIKGEENILITSALPYCNNAPHLGTLIGCVLSADVYSRYCRLRGYNSIYVCGTDEYGTATEMRARQEGLTPDEICQKYWKIHDSVYRWFDIDFDKFGRTHTEKHTKITQEIFKDLKKNSLITEHAIEQYFCDSCQTFLADRYVKGTCPHPGCGYTDAKGDQCDGCGKLIDQLIDPKCSICSSPPQMKKTDHFYIDLPKLQDKLEKWIEKASVEGNWSTNSIAVSKAWIKQGLQERCITRDLKWGTPVPVEGWEKKVFYVWFDAPIGYISITANLTENWEKWWKQSEEYNVKLKQFMAKDNIPFHCVIFPCTLLGQTDVWTKLEQISSCEYLNYEDKKFSKSNGTGVFGDDAEKTGIASEVWRYYLLINRPEKSDTIFTWNEFAARNNNELLANPGNLCNRGLKFCYKSFEKKVPEPLELQENDKKTLLNIWGLFQEYLQALDKIEIKKGLERVMNISSQGNIYMQENEPWVKANQESGRSRTILFVYCNILRFLSLVFEPYLPSLSAKINFLLGFEERTERDEFLIKEFAGAQDPINAILSLVKPNQQINQPVNLFKELSQEEIEVFKAKFGGQQAPVQQQQK